MSPQLLPHKLFPPQPPFAFPFLPSFPLPASPVPNSIPCNEFQTTSLPFLFLARELPLAAGKELSWPLFCSQSLYSSWHGITASAERGTKGLPGPMVSHRSSGYFLALASLHPPYCRILISGHRLHRSQLGVTWKGLTAWTKLCKRETTSTVAKKLASKKSSNWRIGEIGALPRPLSRRSG